MSATDATDADGVATGVTDAAASTNAAMESSPTNAAMQSSPANAAMESSPANAAMQSPPVAARRALGPWSRRVVGALAEVVLPIGGDAPPMSTAEVVRFVDEYVPHMPRLLSLLFPVGLMLLELGAFVLGPSLVPFSAMSLPRRRRYVDGWVHARWRLRRDLIKAVKGLCLLAYYCDPRVGARLGYAVDEHVATVSAERLRRHARDL